MKRVSVIFYAILLLLFAGCVGFVAFSEDFTEPAGGMSQEEYGITPESAIWDTKLEDLAAYLMDKGLIDSLDHVSLSEGIATEAKEYTGIEIYWWDVKNLAQDSAEYKAYTEMADEGIIDLWSSGYLMNVVQQGPFGINPSTYEGDIDELIQAYHEFGVD